ncbi:unnamed protein product [Hyaloperonospora brassicae]|uniref:Inositol polyphosphate-related phosphatase domain-containing protein n=1 Tax=Hyaloperonospora brassicae TaxID=162125 RepID=A0AAV0UC18_HYABA|nr:unnamed protein product [Hyaloperonospora brassicae]
MAHRQLDKATARAPRVRVTRAFSQLEDPETLHELQKVLLSAKTLDVRRLASSIADPRVAPDALAMLIPPPVPPTSPASLLRVTQASSAGPRTTGCTQTIDSSSDSSSGSSSSGVTTSPRSAAWGLPPRSAGIAGREVALERRRTVGSRQEQRVATPRRGSGEWADAAARLSRRVQELELENFHLKNGKGALQLLASGVLPTSGGVEVDGGNASVDMSRRRRGLNKSQSCANGFEAMGLTVAEAAAASHRTRTRRLATAAGTTGTAGNLRSGYWNGTNNVKSSFSCNNLSDLEQPEFLLEKLRTSPPSAVAVAFCTTNGGNESGKMASSASVTPRAHEATLKSDSFQRTSSKTNEVVAGTRPHHAVLQELQIPPTVVDQQSSSSVDHTLDRSFDETGGRITSPRSYFEAGLRTSSFSAGATAPPSLSPGERINERDVRMWVGTWNMGAADPFDDGKGIIDEQRSAAMLQNFLPHGYQLYVLGVQEGVSENVYHAVEAYLNRNEHGSRYYRMELKNGNFMVNHKNQPPDAIIDAVHGRGDGAFVGTKFTGMAVFYCADVEEKIKLIRAGAHKFKLTSGSKGGVAVALRINHTTIVFVNCHLDARNDTYRREQIRNLNASLGRVMGHYSFDLTEQFHHVVWMGDMNYRIVLLDPQMVLHMLEEGRNLELHDKFDGLLNDRRNGGVFEGFTEPHKFPDFYPTSHFTRVVR